MQSDDIIQLLNRNVVGNRSIPLPTFHQLIFLSLGQTQSHRHANVRHGEILCRSIEESRHGKNEE